MIPSGRMDANVLNMFLADNWWVMILLAAWILPWKGVALWQASKRNEKVWFIVLLVVNTVAILEIIYLFFVVKIGRRGTDTSK